MIKIRKCRICGNKNLIKIGSLGKISISDFTDKPVQGKKFPLELVYCGKCTLLQMAHNFNRDLLYKHYWYESHINPVIVENLKEIGSEIRSGIHMDIGCNDGTLLKYSKANYKYGIDPSNIKSKYTVIRDYWENVKELMFYDYITAIACLYDLPDPNKFVKNVKNNLKPNGIFIAQLMTLQPMIENNDIGNICHEHLEYYSYKSLTILFERNGLEIFKVKKNNINGGSYRIYARHYKKGSIKFKEKEYKVKDLRNFFVEALRNKIKFIDWILEERPKFMGYGASTKANTIMQYYGMKSGFVVDINPKKKNKYMSSGAKIINYIPKDTEYLWVFPYGFMDYFKKKEKKYKGKWVTTIPKFKIC